MPNKIMLSLIILLFCFTLTAAEVLIGTGTDYSEERADQKAIADLSSQLSIEVKVNYRSLEREVDGKLEELSEHMVKTYSSVILEDVRKVVKQLKNGQYEVQRILTREAREKVFAQRYQKIRQYAKNGERAEAQYDAGEALKNYYWALLLLKSHPDRNALKNDSGTLFDIWLPTKIQSIIKDIRFELLSREVNGEFESFEFLSHFRNRPAVSLKITYFDGVRVTETFIKDGNGSLILPLSMKTEKEVLLGIDYEYLHLLQVMPQDQDVKAVSDFLPRIPFENQCRLELKVKKQSKKEQKLNLDDKEVQSMIEQIVSYINNRKDSGVRQYFSDQGWEQFSKMLKRGQVSVPNIRFDVKSYPIGEQIMIRSIPLNILAKDRNQRLFREEMTLLIEDDKIAWANFALNDQFIENALDSGDNLNDLEERLNSIQFLEYYKTCFALKETEKIAEIFSDDALIFVGYVRGTTPVDESLKDVIGQSLSPERIEMMQFSKNEYVKRIDDIFKHNEAINLNFKEVDIVKKNGEIYAVQMKQDYYSTNYSDQGYLLLYYNMKDKDNPQIFFRYWQEAKMNEDEWQEMEKVQGILRF